MATATASQPKTHDDIKTADLEKVTDYVEDSEIKDKDIGKVRKHVKQCGGKISLISHNLQLSFM